MKPFDSRRYRRQNQERGQQVRWWAAIPCECVDPPTGQRDSNCTLCEKDGFRYLEQEIPDGIDGRPARAIFYETTVAHQDAEFGLIQVGQTAVSVFRDEIDLRRKHILVGLHFVEPEGKVVVRGSGDIDVLTTGVVKSISLVTQGAMVYGPDLHYRPTETGIEWIHATRPAPGSRYSVAFDFHPRYVVLDINTQLQEMGSDERPLMTDFILVRR
jgi:hypothetical protein